MRYDDILEVSEYKGHKILTVPVGFNQNFSFGYSKAVVISCSWDEIKAFAESEGRSVGNPSKQVTVTEFKGHPLLELETHNNKYPLRFGLSKARALLQYKPEIEDFIRDLDAHYAGEGVAV